MHLSKTALLLVVFAAGCAATRLLAVPAARAGTSPQRWEYACEAEWGPDNVTKMENQMGAEGWELAAAGSNGTGSKPIWCFKRPLP